VVSQKKKQKSHPASFVIWGGSKKSVGRIERDPCAAQKRKEQKCPTVCPMLTIPTPRAQRRETRSIT